MGLTTVTPRPDLQIVQQGRLALDRLLSKTLRPHRPAFQEARESGGCRGCTARGVDVRLEAYRPVHG
jgi:hypothetical protein